MVKLPVLYEWGRCNDSDIKSIVVIFRMIEMGMVETMPANPNVCTVLTVHAMQIPYGKPGN